MTAASQREVQWIEAVIAGIHAHQCRYVEQQQRGDRACFTFPGGEAARDAAATALTRMAAAKPEALRDWLNRGAASRIEIPVTPPFTTVQACIEDLTRARLRLDARLPVEVAAAYLTDAVPGAEPHHVRALAALHQAVIGVFLDGTEVQGLLRQMLALEMPTCHGALGLKEDEKSLRAFGKAVASRCCPCPFDTAALDWHLCAHKLRMWTEKLTEKHTATSYARALLAQPEIRECTTAIRSLPAQRVVVLGHSFTMSSHWASHASFTDIAGHVLRLINPGIEWLHLGAGSLTPTRARKEFLERLLQLRPDHAILVTISRTDEHRADLQFCIRQLQDRGCHVTVFDSVMVYPDIYEAEKPAARAARDAGAAVVEVYPLLAAHPRRAEFPALDVIHTAPPYHTFMAAELVRFLAGKRPAALPA